MTTRPSADKRGGAALYRPVTTLLVAGRLVSAIGVTLAAMIMDSFPCAARDLKRQCGQVAGGGGWSGAGGGG
jgi:hypothetical protein